MDLRRILVGTGSETREIAVLQRPGTGAPGLFWLGGFKSVMGGLKAEALDGLGAESGFSVTRFDYSGQGQSGGDVLDGTISRWLEEALAVFDITTGPQVVVASSMGGWLALLANKALRARGVLRIKAMVLIAPAVDMTEDLMRAGFTPNQLHDLHAKGCVEVASAYFDDPLVLTERLIVDGARHLLMRNGSIETGCPVAILQGGQDRDVPLAHTLALLSHLTLDPVSFTLIPDGDHRLSRPEDLVVMKQTVKQLADA